MWMDKCAFSVYPHTSWSTLSYLKMVRGLTSYIKSRAEDQAIATKWYTTAIAMY